MVSLSLMWRSKHPSRYLSWSWQKVLVGPSAIKANKKRSGMCVKSEKNNVDSGDYLGGATCVFCALLLNEKHVIKILWKKNI